MKEKSSNYLHINSQQILEYAAINKGSEMLDNLPELVKEPVVRSRIAEHEILLNDHHRNDKES